MWSMENRQLALSLTQELEYFPLNFGLQENNGRDIFSKGIQQSGNNAKQKTENQGGFSWKDNMMEKAAERRAGREPDPLTDLENCSSHPEDKNF